MFNFSIFLYQIVNEKQLNLRLGMRMVGLSDIGNKNFSQLFLTLKKIAYWLSWEITNWILMFVYSLIIIFMGYILGLGTHEISTKFLIYSLFPSYPFLSIIVFFFPLWNSHDSISIIVRHVY